MPRRGGIFSSGIISSRASVPGVHTWSADNPSFKFSAVEAVTMTSADEVAKILDLEPHPSGCTGWFRQTFADPTMVDSANGKRAASTSIYFLQRKGMRSAFHRQRSAEVRPTPEFINCFLNKRCAMHSVHFNFYAERNLVT